VREARGVGSASVRDISPSAHSETWHWQWSSGFARIVHLLGFVFQGSPLCLLKNEKVDPLRSQRRTTDSLSMQWRLWEAYYTGEDRILFEIGSLQAAARLFVTASLTSDAVMWLSELQKIITPRRSFSGAHLLLQQILDS
jgi:hypothetical protein